MTPRAVLDRAGHILRRRSAVVLIDGRSGSGKTELAAVLTAATGAACLHLDDLYPGWDGLEAASRDVARALRARRSGLPTALRTWDWSLGRVGRSVVVPVAGPLIVEGCGAVSRTSAPLADLVIRLELPEGERRRRAIMRDGDVFAPHWERWSRQERRFLARNAIPADLVVTANAERSLKVR